MRIGAVSVGCVVLTLACCGLLLAAAEPETELDRALAAAQENEAERGRFYEVFLETELYAPLAAETDLQPGEERRAEAGETIRLFVRDVEDVPTAYAFDSAVRLGALRVPELTSYVRAPGRELLAMLPPNVQLVLNLHAPQSKVLSPEELTWLRGEVEAAKIPAKPQELEAARSAALELLTADRPRQDVIAALRELFAQRPEVKTAWLAHGRSKGSAETPHLVIGIETDADARPVIDAAAPVVARILPDGEYADFFEMGRDRLSKSMRKRGSEFYTRGN